MCMSIMREIIALIHNADDLTITLSDVIGARGSRRGDEVEALHGTGRHHAAGSDGDTRAGGA